MIEKEKAEIMKALCELPEDKKQFMLGYAAGVVAMSVDSEKDCSSKDGEQHEQH